MPLLLQITETQRQARVHQIKIMPRGTRIQRGATGGSELNEFLALPSSTRPATTTGASVRNAIYNIKSIPGDFKKVGGAIAQALSPGDVSKYHRSRGKR